MARRRRTNQIARYCPYSKQSDFHAAGSAHRERLLRAGNQLGKTVAGAAEAAYHLTGSYPDDWKGRRFTRPTAGWVSSPSGETTRDNPQRMLMGRPGKIGEGMIPQKAIEGMTRARGVAELLDTVQIRHKTGGLSTVKFKTYDQGREKWQGETLDFVWFDEEPPPEIYTEGLTRTNATGGIVWLTFTPLLGMSEVVRRFLMEGGPDRHDTNMVIEDAEHIPVEERDRIIAGYPPHEREARTRGVPILGSGRIYPIADSEISVTPMPIPGHWAIIAALDFGWDHPTAAVKLAWDRDSDIVYVTQAYRKAEASPLLHCGALKPWGGVFPWAWPQDGLQTGKGGDKPLAKQYKVHGLNMMGEHAQFPDGSTSVEAGIMEILDRMQTGRFKVFSHLTDWFEEFRLYHRKDGKIVKLADDLMDASRYGVMCLQAAIAVGGIRTRRLEPDWKVA